MKIIRSIKDMQSFRCDLKGSVGLVPTMGYLHQGHLALVNESKKNNDFTIVSIFVNPTQFGPKEDFAKYPRDEQRDASMLEQAGVDAVFIPSASEMYPADFDSWIEVNGVTSGLEGAKREGHFRGVATVCNKLFNITSPTKVYFGQKDAQQVLVVKKMATDLNMNAEVVVIPTVRENDGLAMSSRNAYLSFTERCAATVLYKALIKAREMYATGEYNTKTIIATMTSILQAESLARIDYVAIIDAVSLHEIESIHSSALVSVAVFIGKTRLIDNIILGVE